MTNLKTIVLNDDLNRELKKLANKIGKSQSRVIEESLIKFFEYIKNEKRS